MTPGQERKERYIAAAGLLERYRRGDSRQEMYQQATGDDSDRYFPPAPYYTTIPRWLTSVLFYIEREDAAGRLDELEARVNALKTTG